MLSLSSAGATLKRAFERVADVVSRFTTTEQYGDPTLPPSPEKKRAYRIWFACIALLEIYMVRRTQNTLDEYSEFAVASEFLLHTQVLNVATMLFIDLYTLRSLNALGERSGLSFPSRTRGVPVLKVSEEDAVLFRHCFKLVHRMPVVNCVLLGGKPDGFHAYPVKQIYMMILSPTFFGVMFAVKSVEGLLKLSFINMAFTAAISLSIPFAYKYSESRKLVYIEELGGLENVPRVFTTVAAVLGLAPFVSSLVVRLGKWDFATHFVPDPGSGGQETASGEPATVGLREDGGSELSASAICFRGPEPQFVVIRQSLAGVSPRVTFDGRVLRSSSDPIIDSHTGEMNTLLRVFPPRSSKGDTLIGMAWVTTGYCTKRSPKSFTRDLGLSSRLGCDEKDLGLSSRLGCDEKAQSADAEDPFGRVGGAVPLLFMPNAETALEVNEVVEVARKKMDGANANNLVMRLGNSITRATYNARDVDAMMEVIVAMGMKRCEAMLRDLAAEQSDFRSGDVSKAPSCKGAKGQYDYSRDVRRRRRVSWKTSSSSEDRDVVEGPAADSRVFDDAVGMRTRSRRRDLERKPAPVRHSLV